MLWDLLDKSPCTRLRESLFYSPIHESWNFKSWDAEQSKLDVFFSLLIQAEKYGLPVGGVFQCRTRLPGDLSAYFDPQKFCVIFLAPFFSVCDLDSRPERPSLWDFLAPVHASHLERGTINSVDRLLE